MHVDPDSQKAAEPSLAHLLRIVYRRRLTVAITVSVALVAGLLLAVRPRRFVSEGEIRIQPGTASMYRTSPASALSQDSADKIASETTIMQSRTLFQKVAQELDLANNSGFWGGRTMPRQDLNDPLVNEKVIRRMRSSISVARIPKEELIRVSCTTVSPALSAKIVNSLINNYVAYLFQMRYGATNRASGWLVGQLDDLKNQIQRDQTSITELQGRLGVIGSNDKGTSFLFDESLSSIAKASSEATISRIEAEAKLRFMSQSNPNLIEGEVNLLGSGPNPSTGLLQNLRESQARAASEYSKLTAEFGPNYPEVKQAQSQLAELNRQVGNEQQRIVHQAKLSFDAASANEHMTSRALQQKEADAFASHDDMARYAILLHDYEAHRTLYEGLIGRLREAGITSGMEAGEIDVVDLANLPAIPISPGPAIILFGALFAGLLVGCGLALVTEAADNRIKTHEAAECATGLTLLGMLPHLALNQRESKGSSLSVYEYPRSYYAESLQSMRTNILLSRSGAAPQVIVVTSAVPGEGKSTTTINLAGTFARNRASVLLIECDLRKGSLGRRMGVSNSHGLSDVLTGGMTLEDAVQSVPGAPKLSLLASGPRPPDPAVLIGSQEMRALVERCRGIYDFIFIDSTPSLGLSDAINAGRLADAVVLIVRNKYSDRRAVHDAVQTLRQARLPLIGFMLNDVIINSATYGYKYGSYYEEEEMSVAQ